MMFFIFPVLSFLFKSILPEVEAKDALPMLTITHNEFTVEKFTVIGVNTLILLIIFYFIYRRKRLAD
jgi:hypothetical protein